jgi:hypothetical protein
LAVQKRGSHKGHKEIHRAHKERKNSFLRDSLCPSWLCGEIFLRHCERPPGAQQSRNILKTGLLRRPASLLAMTISTFVPSRLRVKILSFFVIAFLDSLKMSAAFKE